MKAIASIAVALMVVVSNPSLAAQSADSPLTKGFKPPARTKYVAPETRGRTGVVILSLVVDPEGKVRSADVLKDQAKAGDDVRRAAWQWEYEPTTIDGKPVWVKFVVSVPLQPR